MSGLVRDIRAIPEPRPWRRLAAIAAGFLMVLCAAGAVLASKFPNVVGLPSRKRPKLLQQNDFWRSNPGEWVMFAFDQNPVAYYFKPSSVQIFGDRVAYNARFPTSNQGMPLPHRALFRKQPMKTTKR